MEPDSTGGFEASLADVMKVMGRWGPPPYKPEVKALVDKAMAPTAVTGPPGGAAVTCIFGYPMIMLSSPLMFEVLPTPKETALIFSAREIRHVYTDGRPHTPKEDIFPTFWGDSVGHWEGQTLVMDTIAVQDAMSPPGMPAILVLALGGKGPEGFPMAVLSRQARFSERLSMTGGKLHNDMSITDPVMFTRPWHINRNYTRVRGVNRMIHEDCSGPDRNPIVNGQFTLTAPPPGPPPLPPEFKPLADLLADAAR
jgi:hypothetical protein